MQLEKLVEKYSELKINFTNTEQQFTLGLCSCLGKTVVEKRTLSYDLLTMYQDFLCPVSCWFFLFLKEYGYFAGFLPGSVKCKMDVYYPVQNEKTRHSQDIISL